MLTLESITVDYGMGPVLEELSLTLNPRLVHGLVGRNGEGKTTLLNVIHGQVRPQSGIVTWKERPILTEDIAYLETELYFYPMITGEEYLQVFQSRAKRFDYEKWNDIFELPLREYISTYSTGMKRKLALMSIFALDRPLVMLDEPFNGLDLETNLLLSRIIQTLAERGQTVIVTSHILESLTPICDEIHWLHGGRIERTFTKKDSNELRTEILETLDAEKMPLVRKLLVGE
jgi:ABC-2 type transport system ATP-binding protein